MPSASRKRSACGRSECLTFENAVALQVDHLARLGDRERGGLVERNVAVGADEAVLLAHAGDLFLDGTGGLILVALLERRGDDGEAFVFDRWTRRRRSDRRAATKQGFPERHGAEFSRPPALRHSAGSGWPRKTP